MTLYITLATKALFSRALANTNPLRMASTDFNYSVELRGRRGKYTKNYTEISLVSKDPFTQFKKWFDEACAAPEILEANAMCLATSTKSGLPSARFVLLKGFGKDGFKFYTNYNSRKGEELSENPNAASVFYWETLRKSIRIEGTVEKMAEQESTEYFHSRPKDSQIGAACSDQSRPIASRNVLSDREKKLKEQYADFDNIPKPKEWGGFILKPNLIEFWQHSDDGLHSRIRFRIPKEDEVADNIMLHQGEDGWVYEKLEP